MILSGRFGNVKFDPTVASPLDDLISINTFKLSLKTDFEDVTCYLDGNRVYIPGLPDISGTLGGFFNSSNLKLVAASQAITPGFLELIPNQNEPDIIFSGAAYLDLDLDCSVAGAPKTSSAFRAAGTWSLPQESIAA